MSEAVELGELRADVLANLDCAAEVGVHVDPSLDQISGQTVGYEQLFSMLVVERIEILEVIIAGQHSAIFLIHNGSFEIGLRVPSSFDGLVPLYATVEITVQRW